VEGPFPDLTRDLIERLQGFLTFGSESSVLDAAGRLLDFYCFHLSSLLSDIECLTPGTSATLLGLLRTMRYLPASLVVPASRAGEMHGLYLELLTRRSPAVQLRTLIIIVDYLSTAAPPAALPWVKIATCTISGPFHRIQPKSNCDRYCNKTTTHPRLQRHARLSVAGPGASIIKTKTNQVNKLHLHFLNVGQKVWYPAKITPYKLK
jgi:hypothetical protein